MHISSSSPIKKYPAESAVKNLFPQSDLRKAALNKSLSDQDKSGISAKVKAKETGIYTPDKAVTRVLGRTEDLLKLVLMREQ
jgi:hypothetical protein